MKYLLKTIVHIFKVVYIFKVYVFDEIQFILFILGIVSKNFFSMVRTERFFFSICFTVCTFILSSKIYFRFICVVWNSCPNTFFHMIIQLLQYLLKRLIFIPLD